MIPKVKATFNKTITLLQRLPGTWVNHEYVEGGFTTVTFKGNLQPMTPKELEQEQKGEEIVEAIKIYTSSSLEFNITDIIQDSSKQYRIFGIVPWRGHKKIMAGILDD